MSATIIPEDIIATNILRRLPSKSIGQFRCVSKRWLALLTDPHFIQTHQNTLNTNRFILHGPSFKDGSFCSVPYNNNHEETIIKLPFELEYFLIHGSVNGLVFASGYKISLPNYGFTYLVFNPTTKHYVELPSLLHKQFIGLKGFGYDSASGDYKVVVVSKYENYNGDVYLYNLRTNSMKLVMSKSPYQDYHLSMSSGVFVNGHLHWIFNNRSKQELVIVAVSLADEKLTELPPPPSEEVDLSDIDTKLVLLGDKLGIFHQVKGDIWVMNDYGVEKSWSKIVVNGFNQIPFYKDYKPIVFYDNGKLLFLTGNRLSIYHIKVGTFSQSFDMSYMKIKYFIGAYAETLISPPKFSLTSE